jgi:DNA-binding transcriptional LysR family regulator
MTEAARCSNLTLAAVSARIRGMEESIGIPLLRRHARGVVVTAAGEALARHARLLFHQLDSLRRDIAGSSGPPAPETVVLANSSAMGRPLSGVIAEVLCLYPASRIVARERSSEVTVHALHAGAADVGIVTDAVNTDGLFVERLGPDPLVLIAPCGHVLAARGTIRFEEALSHEWIGWGESSALHTHLAMRAYQANAALRVRASVSSIAGVLELVAKGLGVAVLPWALLPRLRPGQEIQAVEIEESWARRHLLVCRRREEKTPATVAVFHLLQKKWEAEERVWISSDGR